ncbi:hypothetical protein A1Q2_00984 [Trichosporon asahii var. asahii CBS 8904]|uniref:Uncharacterized protein n=1 Tax=Trichosporon asahii var. asahii (strain CBS 8904) TaxID=1220162 RepID=K1WVA2_TRIAC|nr:hypothetical protein A1Q2_00984 [Trichosporon asahii var. asahii CBS 8904]
MLEFFPNVHSIHFDTTGDSYLRAMHKGGPGRAADELRMEEEIRIDRLTFCPPRERYLPEGLNYECWYHLEGVTADQWSTAFFDRDDRGELILPDVLRLPAYQLSVWNIDGGNPEWFHVLRRRKAMGIRTRNIRWRIASFDELDMLAETAGVGLRSLEVSCYIQVFEDTSQTATAIMNRIDATRFPDLQTLTLHIDFPSLTAPTPLIAPEWLYKDMPPHLSSIQLDLVLDTWQVDETEGFLPMEYVEYVFEERAPRKFIIDVRTKFGGDFSFFVNTEYYDDNGVVDYPRSNSSFIDFLLFEPLSVARGDSSSSSIDLSSGDDYESDLEDEPESESGEEESSAQSEAEESVDDIADDESMRGSEESRYDEYGLGYDDEGASAQEDDDESRSGSEELCYDEYGSQEEGQDEDASAEDVYMESDDYPSSD